jgi:hypothetical protein
VLLLEVGCVSPTEYQPEGFSGGFSDFMRAPDEGVVIFRGNGYTSRERLLAMTALRCAELTLAHGYRYNVISSFRDISTNSSYTTPGYATSQTYGNVSGFGTGAMVSGNTYTTVIPPQSVSVYKPALMVGIEMSNNPASLQSLGEVHDATWTSQSMRQFV